MSAHRWRDPERNPGDASRRQLCGPPHPNTHGSTRRRVLTVHAGTVGLVRFRAALVALFLTACNQAGSDTSPLPPEATDLQASTVPTQSSAATTTGPPTATSPEPGGQSTSALAPLLDPASLIVETYPVPAGSRPHDVAPAADGGVWYTAQNRGELGWLNPTTGETRHTPLGAGSRPHGVILDAAGAPWITDGGLNAIVRVDPESLEPTVFPLPADRAGANLNTATFDGEGILWFTGQSGIYGRLDPATGEMDVFDAPRGPGPYGIAATPGGSVFYASLAGSYVGAVAADGSVDVLEPPTANQGARRVWSDSSGQIWVSEWNSGNLTRYNPQTRRWTTWPLPGDDPAAYGVFVDDADIVWVSDFGGNALMRFDPADESFIVYPLPHDPGDVRQILGRPGEVWAPESAADQLVLIRTR